MVLVKQASYLENASAGSPPAVADPEGGGGG